jgi:ribosomal protein S18 acetylase RimI-like enzyme
LAEEEGRTDSEWAARLAAELPSDLPLVAEVGVEPIGLAWGRIEPSSPGVAHLYQMWVAPTHRKLGAGKMLLDAVIAWAAAKNIDCIGLGVTCGDTPATRLYSRAGFEPVGEPAPLRPGSSVLAQAMRLDLKPTIS